MTWKETNLTHHFIDLFLDKSMLAGCPCDSQSSFILILSFLIEQAKTVSTQYFGLYFAHLINCHISRCFNYKFLCPTNRVEAPKAFEKETKILSFYGIVLMSKGYMLDKDVIVVINYFWNKEKRKT